MLKNDLNYFILINTKLNLLFLVEHAVYHLINILILGLLKN